MSNLNNILGIFETENTTIIAPQTEAIETIKNQLFTMKSSKMTYYHNEQTLLMPNTFAVYRNDKPENPFGIVTDRYEPIQPIDLLTAFEKAIILNNLDATKLQYIESYGGAKIRFRLPIKTISFTNLRGLQDETKLFLNVETGYDGKTAQKIFIDCYRLVCSNGMRMTTTEATAKYRNTKSNIGSMQLMINQSIPMILKTNEIEELYRTLDKKQITEKMRQEFIKDTLIENGTKYDKEIGFSTKTKHIIEQINKDIEKEIQDAGGTLFALVNGITRYNQHTAVLLRNNRDEFLNYGTGAKLNDSALTIAKKMLVMN